MPAVPLRTNGWGPGFMESAAFDLHGNDDKTSRPGFITVFGLCARTFSRVFGVCARSFTDVFGVCAMLGAFGAVAAPQTTAEKSVGEPSVSLSPASMPRIGTIDARFQSYNVEMLEVTGGKFWRPYGPEFDALLKKKVRPAESSTSGTPAGMDPALYQYRPPIDLSSPRRR